MLKNASFFCKLVLSVSISAIWIFSADRISAQSYWGAIYQLGYDPVKQQVSVNQALRHIDRIYKLSARVSDHLEIDSDLEFKMRDLHSRITALDAANLYDILPVAGEDGLWRAIGIRGRSQRDIYRLSMINPDLEGWLKSDGDTDIPFESSNDRLGNLRLRAFVKPRPNDAYRLAAEAQIYLDDIFARSVPRIIDGLLAAVWTQASGNPISTIKGRHNSSLNRQSISVLESLTLEFPDLIRFLLTYFAIDNIISSNPAGIDDSVLLDIRARLKPEAFLRDFPEIKKLLDELKGMIFFRARIHDELDRLMGLLELDSVDNMFTAQLRIFKGQLLPLNTKIGEGRKGNLSLTTPGCKQLYIAYDMHLNMVGLNLSVDSLQIGLDLNNRDQELDYTACLWQPPETVKAGGWVFLDLFRCGWWMH